MAVSQFQGNNAGLQYTGFNAATDFGQGSIRQNSATYPDLRFRATGAKIELMVLSLGETVRWVVDGVDSSAVVPAGSPWTSQYVTLFDGAEGDHDISVYGVNFVKQVNTIQVTGAAPALAGYPNFNGTTYALNQSGLSRDGSALATYFGIPNSALSNAIRFKATDLTKLHIYGTDFNAHPTHKWALVVDDDIDSRTFATLNRRATSPNAYDWATFSRSDVGEHQYTLVLPSPVCYAGYVHIVGTLNTTSLTARDYVFFAGDSFTRGHVLPNGAGDCWIVRAAVKRGKGFYNGGVGSQRAYTDGSGRATEAGLLSPAPIAVFQTWGANDQLNAVTTGNFRTAMNTIVSQVHADLPTVPLLVPAIFDVSVLHAGRGSYNSEILGAVAAASSSKVRYVELTPSQVADVGDTLHPDAAANITIGDLAATELADALAPPSSGRRNRMNTLLRP